MKNGKEMVELVMKLSTLVKQFLGGREKQNGCLSWELCTHMAFCKDDKNVKSFKSDDGIVMKLFPGLPGLFQKDQTFRHDNGKGIRILHLPNALNYIRVSPASIKKKKHLRQIPDYINDFLNDQNSVFL